MHSKTAKAVRRFCLDCQGGSFASIQECRDVSCDLFGMRLCTLAPLPQEARPLRAIRRHCLDCAGGRAEVRACDAREDCPLWSFRFGVLPGTFKRVAARRRRKFETLLLPGMQGGQA